LPIGRAKNRTTSSPTADYKEAADSKYQRFEQFLSTKTHHPNDFDKEVMKMTRKGCAAG